MSAQSSMNALIGAVSGGILATKKIASNNTSEKPEAPEQDSGKDLKMAAKSRKELLNKINAHIYNKEISQRARTRRIGQILDDFKKEGGGK